MKESLVFRIAEKVVDLIFASDGPDYIYDPDHEKKPSGGYHKTEKGWSKKEEKEDATSVEMTDEQKKLDEKSKSPKVQHRISVAKNKKTHPKTLAELAKDEFEAVRVEVAGNPKTPSAVLDELAKEDYSQIKSNVASNPNTSPETLDKLSEERGDNAIYIQRNIAKNTNANYETLDKLAELNDNVINLALAGNKNTSLKTLKKLSKSEDSDISSLAKKTFTKKIKEHDKQVKDVMSDDEKYLDKQSKSKNYWKRKNVAANSKTHPSTLEKLAEDENIYVQQMAVKNPNCPTQVLKEKAKELPEYVIQNPKCPPEILKELADSDNKYVKNIIAKNPNCPKETLEKLVNDDSCRLYVLTNESCPVELLKKYSEGDDGDKYAVIQNKNCPPEVLDKIAKEDIKSYNEAIVRNPNTSSDTLDYLSKSDSAGIQEKVAAHKNTSLKTLEKLADSSTMYVVSEVIMNKNTSDKILEKIANRGENYLHNVLLNEKCPESVLDMASKSKNGNVLGKLIQNDKVSLKHLIEVKENSEDELGGYDKMILNSKLEKFSKETDENGWNELKKYIDKKADSDNLSDQISAASSKFTHPNTLKKLSNNKNPEVIKSLVQNLNTPSETLDKFLDSDDEIKELLAKNNNISEESLSKLAESDNEAIKNAVINNSNTSMETLEKLTKDKKVSKKAQLQIRRRKGEAVISEEDKEYVKKFYKNDKFNIDSFVRELGSFGTIREETYKEHGITSLESGCPNIEKKMNYFSNSGYKGSNAQKLALLAAFHFGFEKGDFRTDYKKEPPPTKEEIEEYGRYIKIEQDILRKSGLVTKDGKVRLYRNVGQSLFRYHKPDDPIQYSTYKDHYGATMEYRGSHIESWSFIPDLGWDGAKIYADVPIEAVIGSFIGRYHKDSYGHMGEKECTICTSEFVKEVRLVGHNGYCMPEIQKKWEEDLQEQFGATVDDYENYVMPVSQEEKDAFDKLRNSDNPEDRKEALNNPLMNKEAIKEMAQKEKDPDILKEIAGHSKTPVDVLKSLTNNDNLEVQKALLNNTNYPGTELNELLNKTKHQEIKDKVNEILDKKKKEELEKIKNGTNYEKQQVASNPNTTLDVLEMLSDDNSDYVKKSVADNPNCPKEILEKLAKLDNVHIHKAIAENPNATTEILNSFANTYDNKVQNALLKNKNINEETLDKMLEGSFTPSVLKEIAKNEKATEKIFEKIIQKSSLSSVMNSIINSPNSTSETIDKIFEKNLKETDDDIDMYIAQSEKTSPETLKKLFDKPNVDDNIVNVLLNNKNVSKDIMTSAAQKNNSSYNGILINNEKTPSDVLEIIANNTLNKDNQSYMLKKITQHPNCSTMTMKKILNDYKLDEDSKRQVEDNYNNKLKAISNQISDDEPTPEDIKELKEYFPESCKGKSMQELIILFKTLAKKGFFSAPSSTPEEPEQSEEPEQIEDGDEDEILKYLDMGDNSKDEQEIDDYFKKYL